MNSEITNIINSLGFTSLDDFKLYMKSKAKLNEFGAICYTEVKNGLTLNYYNNCKNKYGVGGNDRGIFKDFRFN
mgnify:CR=1 FL=1